MSKPSSAPPRINLDPNPPKYRTPVPSFPRDPRLPSDIPSFLARDTERSSAADPESGAHEVTTDAELTPVESMYGLRTISAKLDELTKATRAGTEAVKAAAQASRDAANESIATRSELRGVADEVKSLTRRVTALELSSKWAPLTLSAVSLTLVLWLGFQAQQTQAQVQALQAQIQLLKPSK